MSTNSADLVRLIETAAEAAVQRALFTTITPVVRHGILTDHDSFSNIHLVQMDGDTASVPCHDVTTGYRIPIGAKVTVLFAPPHQAFIIGAVVPMGPIRQLKMGTDGPPMAVSTTPTDMQLPDVPLIGGVTYALHAHVLAELASVSVDARWSFHVRANGSSVDRVGDLNPRVTGVSHWLMDAWVYYTPDETGDYDLDINAEKSVDGATVMFQANGTNVWRHLTVHDTGVLPVLG